MNLYSTTLGHPMSKDKEGRSRGQKERVVFMKLHHTCTLQQKKPWRNGETFKDNSYRTVLFANDKADV